MALASPFSLRPFRLDGPWPIGNSKDNHRDERKRPMKTMTLPQLATKIKSEHDQAVQTVRKSLDHARKAGELLAKAQKQVMKNTAFKWGRWVEQECGIKERTASNYIRLYRNWSKIEKVADTSTLQVKAALA